MQQLRYMGEFLSRAGITWRVEILQQADAAFENVGSLEFDADEPLVIEWENKSKEEVLCGSTATVKIISPGDRTYEDLYSIEVGRIRLDVYRDGSLYWSGSLDTEFYEEPYERVNNYTVSLIFSDFGVLDRLKYDLANMRTLYDIVNYCIGRCNINYNTIDDSLISTYLKQGGSALRLADIKVRSDNFYDEDGEALTLAEVVEGILQPLALRMVQRAGKVYVYDLNGLYTKAGVKRIEWNGDSQTMGVDVVYNNAKITWSAYAQSGNLLPETCWGNLETPASKTALNNLDGGSENGARYYSYHHSTNLKDWIDASDCGFTIWITREGRGATLAADTVNFFKIVPQYDGAESEGIAIYWRSLLGINYANPTGIVVGPGVKWKQNGTLNNALAGTLASCGPALFKSESVWIPPVDNSGDLLLRITVDMLMDPRFNPFESPGDSGFYLLDNAPDSYEYVRGKTWYEQWSMQGNFVYVPVTIKYQPDNSDEIYCWNNKGPVTRRGDNAVTTLPETYGQWELYTNDDDPNVWGYLAYYDAEDRAETSGVLGWKKNRPAINPHTGNTQAILTNAEVGQYIPYPFMGEAGGRIWIEVRGGSWQISDGNVDLSSTEVQNPYNLWDKYCWLLMKLPEIEIVNGTQFGQTINTDDVEYNAELNSKAKEPIELDTICGSSAKGIPTARGAYFSAFTGIQVKELTRAGRTTQIEDLLIGTLYSQFAQRRTALYGEAEMLADRGVVKYEDDNQPGKLFVLSSDIQDVIADTSDAKFIEFRPDEYIKKG